MRNPLQLGMIRELTKQLLFGGERAMEGFNVRTAIYSIEFMYRMWKKIVFMFAMGNASKLSECGCSSFDVETINNEFRISILIQGIHFISV